jgi:hypothetical protein
MDLLLARDLLAPDELPRVREACAAIFGSRGKRSWPPILYVYPGCLGPRVHLRNRFGGVIHILREQERLTTSRRLAPS